MKRIVDTGKADTGQADTGQADTGQADTGKTDASTKDAARKIVPPKDAQPKDPPLGRREEAKNERRARIIAAARELIRETGDAGLSMRALAARAGVSLATPYNLFGSKRAIVLAVLQDVRDFQGRFATQRSSDPLERIFTAVDMAVAFYADDPKFYRTLWSAVFATSDDYRSAIFNPKRNAFWQNLIAEAQAAGAIRPEIDADLLFHQLDRTFKSVMLEWILDEAAADDLAATVRLGYALTLKGACAPDWRGPLQARILDSQRRLRGAAQGA